MLNTGFSQQHMDSVTNQLEATGYKIGAVSKITGIGTETLRAWERRYTAVVPSRTESGDRQYSRNDITKLLLLKTLVDHKISIGTVAQLEVEELKKLAESNAVTTTEVYASKDADCSVALLGESFPLRILDGLEEVQGIKVTAVHETIQQFQESLDSKQQVNIVIFEKPTINTKTQEEITKVMEASGAWHAVVIYGFANQEQIEKLQSSQVTVVRSSVDVQELARICIVHSGGSEKLPSLQMGSTLHYEQTIPSRIFSNKQLAKLMAISNTLKCECPNHVSDLVNSLVAFEIYSAECENTNDQDAALHSYLHATTAQARSMMEEALSHLIRVEGIDINQ